MEYIHHYDSPLGGITMASDGKALTGLWFDGQKYFGNGLDNNIRDESLPVFDQTDQWLDIYFSGKAPGFTPPLNMKTTPFRKAVWEILLTIPFGKTMTYGEIADRVAMQNGLSRMSAQAVGQAVGHNGLSRMSAQAVGQAVGHNAISLIIPCHRVVGANGSLTGYAGGIDKKAKLLALEQVDMSSLFGP